MNFIASVQKQFEQGWRHIIRPARTPYNEAKLGPALFKHLGVEVRRYDFILSNRNQQQFPCSLWLPSQQGRVDCVVYLHGNTSNRIEGMQYLDKIIMGKMGFCTFDFSGCGNAEGQYISLGFWEQQNLKLVLEYLKQHPKIDRLALWGRSMGAVTALLYLPQDCSIASVVLDSPFKSLKGLVEDMAQKSSNVPGIVLSAGLKLVDRKLQEKAQFSLYKLDPLKLAAPNIFIPAFFIVGIEDEIIPIEHTGQLFQAFGGDDKVIRMVNGGHNDNRPDLVIDTVVQFLIDKFAQVQKIQKSLPETVDTKEQEKEEFSPTKTEEYAEQVEEAIKEGKFSISKFFNIFTNIKDKKVSEAPPIVQEQKQQKKQEIVQLDKKQAPQPEEAKPQKKKPKKHKKKKVEPNNYQMTVEEKVREYSFCYM